GNGLYLAGKVLAIAQGHQVQGLAGGEHLPMAWPGMVRMAVGDHRPRHGAGGVDIEISDGAVEPSGRGPQEGFRTHDPLYIGLAVHFARPLVSFPLLQSSGDPALDRRLEWARAYLEDDPATAAAMLADLVAEAPGFAAAWFLLGEAREKAGDASGAA